jgi:hypothetical protein
MRGYRFQTARFALSFGALPALGKGQKPESAGGKAGSRGRLEPLTARHPMTRNEIRLLKELTAAGERGRVINTPTSSARSEIAYLTSAHYIKRLSHRKKYVITERGREALKAIAD